MRFVKRAFEVWPYVFLLVSVSGLIYIVIIAGRG